MLSKSTLFRGCALSVVLVMASAASETQTYSYDALGRLISTSTSGGPNTGTATSATFDPAGNRSNYTVTGASQAQSQQAQALMTLTSSLKANGAHKMESQTAER